RGRSVGEGYWPNPSCSVADSVYVTTDLAELKDGAFFLRGRASDVINVAGRKISPETIERLLQSHPSVRECLVFGVAGRDAQRGDKIIACIVRRNGTSAEDLRQFVLART